MRAGRYSVCKVRDSPRPATSLQALTELVRRVRERHPDIFIEFGRPPMDLGIWSLRQTDACFTVDEFAAPEPLPGMNGQPLNIIFGDKIRRWSRIRVHRHFFPHWMDQPQLFSTRKLMRQAGIEQDGWPWESEGLDYILLSAMKRDRSG